MPPQFVKVPSSVAPSALFDLLLAEWHLPTPNLVVSLVGVEQPFTMKSWLRDVLRKGLVKAAQSTGEAPTGTHSPLSVERPSHRLPRPFLDGGPQGSPPSTWPAVGAAPGGCSRGAEGPRRSRASPNRVLASLWAEAWPLHSGCLWGWRQFLCPLPTVTPSPPLPPLGEHSSQPVLWSESHHRVSLWAAGPAEKPAHGRGLLSSVSAEVIVA